MRGLGVVRDHDNGLAEVAVQPLQEGHDLFRVLRVQRPSGLVRHQKLRVAHDGPGHGHPLLLASRELARIVLHAVREVHPLHGRFDLLPPLPAAQGSQQQGQFHVLEGGEDRDQVVVLEDEAHVGGPPARQFVIIEPVQGEPADLQVPTRGPVDAGDEVQEGGLAAAAGSHEGVVAPGGDVQVDALEHRDFQRLAVVALGHSPQADDRIAVHRSFTFTRVPGSSFVSGSSTSRLVPGSRPVTS